MFFKTFAEKQIEKKGRKYDSDIRRAREEIERLKRKLCDGCDGHECDEDCAYPMERS